MFSSESIEFPFLQNQVWPSEVSLPIALGAAFLWGAMHVMSPGHGKTVVGAYLVGSRATAQHALFLGLTTTIAHSAGVFALALLALFASQFILPEQVYPWLSFGSGLIVVILGINLFISRWKSSPILKLSPLADSHEHEHCHHHHSHVTPETDSDRVSWSSLLALGISSGLMPCPSALVVLLAAIAIGKIGFGLLMVLAFSFGMAAALIGLGLLLVSAKNLLVTLPQYNKSIALITPLSALLIALLGLGMTAQAFLEIRH